MALIWASCSSSAVWSAACWSGESCAAASAFPASLTTLRPRTEPTVRRMPGSNEKMFISRPLLDLAALITLARVDPDGHGVIAVRAVEHARLRIDGAPNML